MNVCVTGGAGFVGSHIAEAWLARGAAVLCFDNLVTGRRKNVPAGAGWFKGDIIAPEDLDYAMEVFKPEVVYHEAAQMDVRKSVHDPLYDADNNICGSIQVLQACVKHHVRKIVYASTGGAVYGPPQFLPLTEQHPINPACPYGISKHTVEHYLALWKDLYGLDYTVLRYPNVYGPRQNPRGEAGVVAIFADLLLHGEPVTVFGTGEETRDYVFVSDIARANVLAATAGGGQIMNLGSGVGTSTNAVLQHVADAVGPGEPVVKREPLRPGEVTEVYLDASRAEAILGWQPTIEVSDGMAATVDYIRNTGW